MLDGLRNLALSLCGTLIVTGILWMLLPEQSAQKALRMAVSLFFLLSLASPLVGSKAQWQVDWEEWAADGPAVIDFQELTRPQLLSSFSDRLEREAEALLHKEGIEPLEIHFSIHTQPDGSISITSLEIVLDAGDRDYCASAIASLNESFGVTATVAFTESEAQE